MDNPSKKLRILNLEDNPMDTELTLAELTKAWPDMELDRVETGDEFDRALQKGGYDLILADFNLPSFDGFSALDIVVKKYSDIPFIFLTGAMGEESAIETLKKGATDFVIKGRLFRLIPAVKRALAEAEQRKIQRETEQKIKHEMEISSHLLMIAEATSQITDIGKLLKQIVLCGSEIMKYDYCFLYLYNKETGLFRPAEQYGLPREMIARFMIESLPENAANVKEVFEKKEPMIIKTISGTPDIPWAFTIFENLKTVVEIPLIARTQPVGIILAYYKKDFDFGERQKKIMQGVAHQTSMALDQARLYRDSIEKALELSGRIETIQVMHEIDKSILSSLNAGEILENVTHLVSRMIICDRATVMRVDGEKKSLIYSAGFGISDLHKGDTLKFGETSLGEIVETGKVEYMPNLADMKKRLPFEEKLFREGFLSHIRIPLYLQGEIAAVLVIGSKRASAFTVDHLSLLEKLSAQVSVALQNARLVSDLEELFIGTVKSLSSAIDAKSHWTSGHSSLVAKYSHEIGKKLMLSDIQLKELELGALLHDIGKLGTYESILDKPGKLNEEEFKLIKQHPIKGAEILSPIAQLKNVIPAIRHHHEFYNGKGYPDGLKGDEIPLMARILCLADSVDSMSSDRPYRKGRPKDEIIQELKNQSGTQFDPEITKAFIEIYS